MTQRLDMGTIIGDPNTGVVVCCGSGGVGKTTTAAALALAAAERGRAAVVLTIDPARRLADALGVPELDNTPRPVNAIDTAAGGSLDAMMLDMKRTFDEVVLAHTTPAKAEQVFANPFYQALSSSFAGTQEYMAMEKLGQLIAARRWDLIVVDTPPSRSALDFLDAPDRLARFLDGRMIRLLAAPAKAGGRLGVRVVGAGFAIFSRILTRVIGTEVITDISTLVAALETMFGGFRARAQATYDLLRRDGTAFVVVATPEPDALREASYFMQRLATEQMPLAGLVLNRVHSVAPGLTAASALAGADALEAAEPDHGSKDSRMAAAVLRIHAALASQVAGEQGLRDRFCAAHPDVAVGSVPALAVDVHDLPSLRAVAAALQAGAPAGR